MLDFSALPTLDKFKDAATIASPLTTLVLNKWLGPKFDAINKDKEKGKEEIDEEKMMEIFGDYLNMAYMKNYYMNTLVYPSSNIPLEDLYVPLTLETRRTKAHKGKARQMLTHDSGHQITVKSFTKNFIPNYGKVLIKDVAGMGKSTVLKFLFLKCAQGNFGVPVFIQLRQLRKDRGVLDIIVDELSGHEQDVDRTLVTKLIARGDFIFFLDGYDEIPLESKDDATRELQDFIDKSGNNQFVLSSRTDPSLPSFQGFQLFTIKPLEQSEALNLIRKYDKFMVSDDSVGELLISKLAGKTLEHVHEFLTNPLLVSLLYKSFSFKPLVPLRLETFYRQVYDALFENHDLSKPGRFVREKHSRLDSDDFHRVLRALAFLTIKKGLVEYTKDEILSLIRKSRERDGLGVGTVKFVDKEFLLDLHTTVPLFVCEGDYFRWSHKSLQEYFAAEFICRDSEGRHKEVLRAMCSSENLPHYLNVLRLCRSIDEKTFRKTLVFDLVSLIVNYADKVERECPGNYTDYVEERVGMAFSSLVIMIDSSMMNVVTQMELNNMERWAELVGGVKELQDVDFSDFTTCSVFGFPTGGKGADTFVAIFKGRWQLITGLCEGYGIESDITQTREPGDTFVLDLDQGLEVFVKKVADAFSSGSGFHPISLPYEPSLEKEAEYKLVSQFIYFVNADACVSVPRCRRLLKQIKAEIKQEVGEEEFFGKF